MLAAHPTYGLYMPAENPFPAKKNAVRCRVLGVFRAFFAQKSSKRMAGRYIVSHMNTESSVSRTGIENIQDALIDVLLLAECKKILGTKLSTFTECAWWFGGCKDILIME